MVSSRQSSRSGTCEHPAELMCAVCSLLRSTWSQKHHIRERAKRGQENEPQPIAFRGSAVWEGSLTSDCHSDKASPPAVSLYPRF